MDLHIAGKTALVTGASQGIGLAIAQGLAAEGVHVVVNGRNESTLSQVVADLKSKGAKASFIAADVSVAAEVNELFQTLAERNRLPDILIINAGGPPRGKAVDLSDELLDGAYQLTFMSAVRLARAALPHMQHQGWGRMVAITSLSVKQPVMNLALSNSLRAGVTGYLKTLATEIIADGITVNAVGPGYTDTERLNELFADEAAKARFSQDLPAKRLGTPEEVAAAAVFLASEQAAYITGQTIIVDGGFIKGLF
ncbi:MAG: SDR family oxidoreductase [Deinococcales bacterium]